MKRKLLILLTFVALLVGSQHVMSDEFDEFLSGIIVNPENQFKEKSTQSNLSMIGEVGERYDPFAGNVGFYQLDIDLPGNFDLPVKVARTKSTVGVGFEYGRLLMDWDLDIPFISLVMPYGSNYLPWSDSFCSTKQTGLLNSTVAATFSFQLHIDGEVKNLFRLDRTKPGGANYPSNVSWITKDHWIIRCNVGGAIFEAKSPKGDTYKFTRRDSSGSAWHRIAATEVMDMHGNWVKYSYDALNKLNKIYASDGRSIALEYDMVTPLRGGKAFPRLKKVKAHGNEWHYQYKITSPGTVDGYSYLSAVIRPDGKSFKFGQDDNVYDNRSWYYSWGLGLRDSWIETPEGNRYEYWLDLQPLCRANFYPDYVAGLSSAGNDCQNIASFYLNTASWVPILKTKIVKLAEGKLYEWRYNLEHGRTATPKKNVPVPATRIRKVITPTSTVLYEYLQNYTKTNARPISVSTYNADQSELLKKEEYFWEYRDVPGTRCDWVDCEASFYNWRSTRSISRLVSKTITLGADKYTQNYKSYNAYDALTKVQSINNFSNNERWDAYSYLSDTAFWSLNRQAQHQVSTTDSNWTTISEVIYNSANASVQSRLEPAQIYQFGQLQKTIETRHVDGLPYRILLGDEGRWVEYLNYKRGTPGTVSYPDRYDLTYKISEERRIDDFGNITYFEDTNGNCTSYQYDNMQRLTLIDPCENQWSNTLFSYASVTASDIASTNVNMAVGQLKIVQTKGRYEKTSYIGGMGKAVLTRERDLDSVNDTTRYTTSEYDDAGRLLFMSYPSNVTNEVVGIRQKYNAIGRVTETKETSTGRTSFNEYLAGNKLSYTNFKGHKTLTHFLSYGEPEMSQPVKMVSAISAVTQMQYNIFKNIVDIEKEGFHTRYVYDEQQRLCKMYRPESDWTYFAYNTLGDVSWKSQGVKSTNSDCDRSTVPDNLKLEYTYDYQGKLIQESALDGTVYKKYTRDAVGNIKALENGVSTWRYKHNSLNLIEKESLDVGDKEFVINPGYDNMGNINRLLYPSGRYVEMDVNALGDIESINGYVNHVSYEPGGKISGMHLANGLLETHTFYPNKILQDIILARADTDALSLHYRYDANLNVESIEDNADPAGPNNSIQLFYDGVDRLSQAFGPWGIANSSYDKMDNIVNNFVLLHHNIQFSYDVNNRLASTSGSLNYLFDYDNRGNVINNGFRTFEYDLNNQLTTSGNYQFLYDGYQRRILKANENKDESFVYSASGKLLHKLTAADDFTDYIYINDRLIAKDNGVPDAYNESDINDPDENVKIAVPYTPEPEPYISPPSVNLSCVGECKKMYLAYGRLTITVSSRASCNTRCHYKWFYEGSAFFKTDSNASKVNFSRVCRDGIYTESRGDVWAEVTDTTTGLKTVSNKLALEALCYAF